MGRLSTGAMKTAGVCRIDMRYLTKWGAFKYSNCSIPMSWSDGSSIGMNLINFNNASYLELNYTLTDRAGIKHDLNYKVYLDKVPSNLGRGFVYYFLCPTTGRRCRILYRAYGCHTFRSRGAFSYRLYYPAQAGSKRFRVFDKKESAEVKYQRLTEGRKRHQDYFKGKRTMYSLKKEISLKRYLMLEEETERYYTEHLILY